MRPTRRLLTSSEAADYLGIHYNTLVRWASAGKVAHYRLVDGRGDRRFDVVDLDEILERHGRRHGRVTP